MAAEIMSHADNWFCFHLPQPPSTPLEPWQSFLTELDRAASDEVRLQCLGGFVVTQLYGLQRPPLTRESMYRCGAARAGFHLSRESGADSIQRSTGGNKQGSSILTAEHHL